MSNAEIDDAFYQEGASAAAAGLTLRAGLERFLGKPNNSETKGQLGSFLFGFADGVLAQLRYVASGTEG